MANWWDKYSEPVASGPAASGNWWDKYAVADDAPDFGDVNSGVSSSAPDPNASFLDSAWRANKAQMGPIFAGNVKRMAAEVSDPIAGLLNGTFGKPAAEDAPELSLTVNPNGNTSLPASPLIAPDAGMALMDAARGEPLRNATLRDLQQSGLAQARAGGAELQQARTDMEVPESGLERYAKLAAISAGPTLAGMTAGIVTKSPAVGAGVSTLFAVPSAYGEARDAGHSVEDAIKYAGVVGGAEVVSERLGFDALLGKLATRLPAGKLATVFGTLEKSIPGRALTGAGVEGTTEALSQAAQNAYKIAGLGEHMTFDEFMTDMKDSFGAGAMIGGPLAGSHAAAQSLAAQNDPEARIRRLAEEVIGSAPERIQTPETQAVDAGRDAARAIFAEANISNDTGAVIPDPRAIDFSQQADLETGIAPVGVAPESMGDLDQQLAGITPQPVATEPARYALSERDQLTFDHLQKSALEADRTAGEAERRGEDGSRYRKAADSYRATADKISERSTPVATPVAPPASAPIDREALLADLAEPELIRGGSRVFYRGDVPSMRARLAEAGLSEGMRKTNEDGTDAGLYFPARMQAEVDAVLRPNAGQAPVQVDAVADSAPETAAPMEVEQSPNIGTGIETKSNRNGEYLSVSNGEGTPEVRVSHSNTGVYSRLIFDSGKRSDTVLNKNGDFVDAKEIIRNANEFTGAENVAWTGSPESRQFIVEQKALSESLSDDYYRERMQIIKDLVTGQIDLAEASKRAAELGADKQEAPVASPAGNQDRVEAIPEVTEAEASQIEAPTESRTEGSILEVPIDSLTLSDDVPQFKSGARSDGVVEPLGGTFDRRGTGPIQIWRRKDGRMEVVSGRHRLDLARRSGEKTIPAQVYNESDGFDAQQAASLDAELNIRDGQGKVKDYVQYFSRPAFDGPDGRQQAESRGLLARATGKRAYTIARQGDAELIAAHSADQITDEAAVQIAQAAPNNAPLQALGMKLVQEGKSITVASNAMRAVRSMQGDRPQNTADMFGFDDSAIQDAVKMANVAARKQREIAERLAAITGAAKRPEIARREGVDVRDPQALPARIAQLRAEKAEWDDWATDPAKVNEIRAELGMEPQPEFARAEDPAEFVDDVTAPMFSRGLRPRSEIESAPVGAWIDGGNVPGIGPTAFQVRDVPLDKISPVELDSVGDVGPEKRSDVGRYTEAMRRGEQFPNARGYELENGKIKLVDGHRRLLAAKAAGKTSLRIAVNPLDDSAKSAMFSRRTGGASGDMFGGATIEDANRASPRSRMPEAADLFGGPSMQERVGAAERARDSARNSGDGKRADTGDGGLFDGPRPEQAILRSQRKQEDDYRGLHRAPSRESGSPLSDLSNTYPDDVYGKNAAQYYGHHGGGHPMDRASVRIIQSYKNEPDAPVKIYRAVPTDAGAEINAGDWVTINKDYAKEHGESQFGDGYKIIEKSVKAKDIYTNGDSIHEWGYDPEVSSVLKSKRPDAKGLEVDENIELTPEEMAAFNRQVDNRQRQPENRANDAQRLPADTGLVRRPADGTTAPERAGMVSARGNRDSQSSARQVSPAADAKPDLTGQPPKFGQWFRQSKMKDAKARPMEFHHATDADFDTFDAGKRGSSTGFAPTGLGNWFSQDAGAIKGYGSKVLSGHLRLENPKVMDSHELPDLESKADYEALAKKYKVEGYDGLYFPDSKQAVAFDSVQFKENRNSGEYSESPNIYRSQHADNQSETPQVTTKKARPEELIEARKRRGNLRQLLDCLNA